jgi:hypothetical protein
MQSDKKYCRECHKEIHGRRDKQYCSDYCRAAHFNHHHAEHSSYMREVNKVIRNNRNILASLRAKGNTIVHRLQLLQAGFNFEYHTTCSQKPPAPTHYYCYEYGYVEIQDGFYSLVSKARAATNEHASKPDIKRESWPQF